MVSMLRYFSIILCVILYLFTFSMQVQGEELHEKVKVIVNIPSRTLDVYKNDKIINKYAVGVGTKENKTPVGRFSIIEKEVNPTWIKPVKENEDPVIIKSGPDNPLGYRWIGFADTYGIHGTNHPESIGGYVSNGCIRMKESDVEELFEMVPLQTYLEIRYDRILLKQDMAGEYTLFIYPDEYQIKPVNVNEVQQKLTEVGLKDFVSEEQIKQALQKNSSSMFKIGKPYAIMVFGKKINEKAIKKENQIYLPVNPIATEAKMEVRWDPESLLLTSAYGNVDGYNLNDRLYVKEGDLIALFHLYSRWYPDEETMYLDYEE